jgi:cbb3-type cytochrome oxidase maturation protein
MAETIVQFTVALFMSMGALCIFIWAVLSGMFTDVEGIAERVYRAEVKEDEHRDPTEA